MTPALAKSRQASPSAGRSARTASSTRSNCATRNGRTATLPARATSSSRSAACSIRRPGAQYANLFYAFKNGEKINKGAAEARRASASGRSTMRRWRSRWKPRRPISSACSRIRPRFPCNRPMSRNSDATSCVPAISSATAPSNCRTSRRTTAQPSCATKKISTTPPTSRSIGKSFLFAGGSSPLRCGASRRERSIPTPTRRPNKFRSSARR